MREITGLTQLKSGFPRCYFPSVTIYIQKKNYDHFIPSADIDDQRFCNLIGEETQLATSNQEVVSHATLDDCVYTKNLRDWSIPSILFEIMMIKETCNLLGREA